MYIKQRFLGLAIIIGLLSSRGADLEASSTRDVFVKYSFLISGRIGNRDILSHSAIGLQYLQINADNYLYASNLSLQSLKTNGGNNTSGWKKAGIYGIEFAAGGIGTSLPYAYAYMDAIMTERYYFDNKSVMIITIGDALLGGTLIWLTGRLMKQDGSLWKAMVGAGIGGFIGSIPWCIESDSTPVVAMCMVGLSFAPLGAVIGYNLK